MAHSGSVLANQKARNAIVGAESLLNSDICLWTLSVPRSSRTIILDNYPGLFLRQTEAIVYVFSSFSWGILGHVTPLDQSRAREIFDGFCVFR